jgi:hypothetical protein
VAKSRRGSTSFISSASASSRNNSNKKSPRHSPSKEHPSFHVRQGLPSPVKKDQPSSPSTVTRTKIVTNIVSEIRRSSVSSVTSLTSLIPGSGTFSSSVAPAPQSPSGKASASSSSSSMSQKMIKKNDKIPLKHKLNVQFVNCQRYSNVREKSTDRVLSLNKDEKTSQDGKESTSDDAAPVRTFDSLSPVTPAAKKKSQVIPVEMVGAPESPSIKSIRSNSMNNVEILEAESNAFHSIFLFRSPALFLR